jgi:hypothetical protein
MEAAMAEMAKRVANMAAMEDGAHGSIGKLYRYGLLHQRLHFTLLS